ncbi:dethiobiotin synthase [Pseudocolwellia sp. AS88]|uniref:dethiobiotin synthase n=1 Tax=Pseudocolwellia sp. AS88 TaxID=3063958 RepID=UPI0026E9FF28|nr:dethiobiotin synthase [Pseudocolwellia sp. AS88]MDO7084852.1 dethiobiotin synthase [Pseudocolwellia sp. AS88]
MSKFFITATDTDAGKTFVATALVKALVNTGKTVAVYKPISAGCEVIDGELINEDAFLLQQVANSNQSISNVNPIAYEEPIAPHIAAAKSNQSITVEDVLQHYTNVTSLNADITLTEGAGGWRLPLGNGKYLSEFVQQSEQKVILVVNMKLGCLNHAILTYESILSDGLECVGWVANTFEGMNYLEENITELMSLIKAPMIARLNNEISTDIAATKFDLSLLT